MQPQPNRAYPPPSLSLATCTNTAKALPAITLEPPISTAPLPSKDTHLLRTTWGQCTTTDWGFPKASPTPSSGSSFPPKRATPWANATSHQCISKAKECGVITKKPRDGSAQRLSRDCP